MMDGTHSEASLARAANWIEALILGPVATTIAVLAIAGLGFAMLSGRLSVRRGLTALFGCFITFGASSIAHGLMGLAQREGGTELVRPAISSNPTQEISPLAVIPARVEDDPYAGASIRN